MWILFQPQTEKKHTMVNCSKTFIAGEANFGSCLGYQDKTLEI